MPDTTNPPFMDELIRQFLGANPTAAFNTIFSNALMRRNPFGDWLRGQSDELFGRYLGQVSSNPNLNYLSFLEGQDPLAQFMALAPSQRGVSYSRFSPTVKPQKPVGFL